MSRRRTALITGAGGGLGRALVCSFHRAGYDLLLTDRDEHLKPELECTSDTESGNIHYFPADLTDAREMTDMVTQAVKAGGQIDVLVNNAAISTTRSFWEISEQDWDTTFAINVKALFFLMQKTAAHMPSGSSIINIASVAGRAARPMLLHYAASKAAVISITRSAAAALAERSIRVNAVAPGMIDTAMLHNLQQNWKTPETPSPRTSLLGRVAQPEEIASSVLFLAGESSGYITGQTLNVCGGIVMS